MSESPGRSRLKCVLLSLLLITTLLLITVAMAPQAAAGPTSWSIEEVENVDNGYTFDVAYDVQGHAHMIYVDLMLGNIMYATNATGAWVNETVGGDYNNYGINCAIDSNGKMHFSYYNDNQHLGYGTNSDGTWQFTEVDTSMYSGSSNDIAVDANGYVHIVYSREPDDDHRHLMYAHNTLGSWTIETADSTYYNRGDNCHLALDSDGKAHISYNYYWGNCITYVTNVNGYWERMPLNGGAYTGYYNDIALDSNDNVHILYTNSAVNNPLYATNAGGSWSYATLDDGSRTAYGVSITIDAADIVHVNFFSWDDKTLYYSNNEGGSFAAKQPVVGVMPNYFRIFANGDEVVTFYSDSDTMIMYMARASSVVTWTPSFSNSPVAGQETVAYAFEPEFNETVTDVSAITNAPFLSWSGTAFTGTPGLDDAGVYYINVTATSEAGTLSDYQNSTFTIMDTWGPMFMDLPYDGQETVTYGYEPALNESYTVTAYSTNADFLSWVGNMYLGTPGSSDAGEYWINVTVRSTAGLLSTTMNETFIIKDTWAPVSTASPLDGQETAYYEFRPEFNDTSAVIVNMETNASFLELVWDDVKGFDYNGLYFAGTPGENDAGEYWINVTAFSDDGLLFCYLNETFVIEEAYANHIINTPLDVRETEDFQFYPLFDGAMRLIDWHSDADWMLLYGPFEKGPGFPNYWYGTPAVGDAGTYYLNITLQSIGGLLYTTHNFTFAVNNSWGPSFENAPGDGRVTVPYVYEPQLNETDATVVSYSTNATFLVWNGSAYIGTPGPEDAGTYWINITGHSPSGLLDAFSNQSFEILPMPRSLRINSDADMLWAVSEFKWAGDGSEDDPFIVTGLIIDSQGIDENSLFIGNVTYYFVVTQNDLGNAGPAGSWTDARSSSLYIYNCDGASIEDNRLWGSSLGLCLMGCTGISVDENLIELNVYAGIAVLSDCQFISIENNTVDANWGAYGMWIKGTAYVLIVNNTVSSACNAVGIEDSDIGSSSFIIVRDNRFDDIWNGVALTNVNEAMVDFNTITNLDINASEAAIVIDNGINIEVVGNIIADGGVGIRIYESSHLRLEGNDISVIGIGVYLNNVDNAYLANGSITADTGIEARGAYQCEFRGVDISQGSVGVNLNYASESVLIADCSLSQLDTGVLIEDSLECTVLDCDLETDLGIDVYYSDSITVSGCVMNGTFRGIQSFWSYGDLVVGNTVTNSTLAILLTGASFSRISGNMLSGNAQDIVLNECSDTMVDGNAIAGERQEYSGIFMGNCVDMELYSNEIENGAITFGIDYSAETMSSHVIADNNTVGGKPVYYYANGYFDYDLVQEDGGQIIIASASSLVITGLRTTSCTAPVLIFYSDTIEMSGLELSGAGVGVTMVGSTAINIIGGSISNMSIGIMGTGTTNAIISEMHLVGNFMGISMDNQVDRCAQLIINNNLIEDSGLYGIVYDGVDQSVIHNNVIANSTGYGMRIMASTEVMVTSNLFYRNNGVGDIYSVPPFQVFDDTIDSIYDLYGWGNFWSEQLGPDADGDGLVDEFAYEIAGWMHYDNYPLAFVFTSEPLTEARNRIAYEYQATLDNEGVFGLVTDASFLSIDPETGLVSGTPDSFGTFHVNVSATLMGYLTIWQNYTLVIEDTWAPEIAGEAVDGKETVEYVYEPQFNETVTDVIADTDAPFLVWNGTAFVGTPGLSHAGGYYVNITATSLDGLLTSYLNQTFTVEDSWAAQFENAPTDGQETVSYVFEPQFNETAAITGHETNAPFLSWNGTAFVGTPTTADAGEYWINITVVSVDGLLGSYLNSSFIIGDSWAPSFLNAPGNGQETLEYVYVPEFNETAVVTAHLTNAPFLSWNGTAFVGTPTTADAGEYWINITAFSVDGLLGSYQNLNLMIGEAWSPEFANAPGDGQETMEYIYAPLFNETVSMTATETNAPFLTWNGSAFVGTPTIADAGTYWINITAISVDGLLEAFQNTTFAIGDSWSPEIVSAAEEHGRETLDYVYAPEANETVVWSMNTNAPFLDWNGSAVVGLPNVTSAGTYYVNLTAVSLAGLLSSWQNYTLVINDTWAAELTNGPAGGQETVNYIFEPAFNETVTITGHATNAPFLSWNGTAFVGAPTVADAGQYWVSVTAASVPGLLEASWNLTFMIGEAWAPEIVSEPPASDLWASLEYSYQLEANESVVFTLSTDAGFLNLVNGTISGTMGAGSFYVNVTATSVNGLLSSYQNFTLTVGTDDAAPSVEIISPADGARLNVTSVMLELNVTDEGSGVAGIWVRVGEGNWTTVSGTNFILLLPEGENSITVRSVDAVGNEAEETVSVLIDLTAPTVTSFIPQGEDEALDAPIVITFSEAMDAGSVIVIVNGQPAIITWNGSLATVAGDWEYATEYTVLVTGQDLAGNAMEPMSFSFTTAAQLVTISGVLLDAEGNPVANANISVNGVVVAVTGEDGSYSFQLTPGEYLVAVTAEGFDTQSLPLTVGTEPSSLDVVMHGTQEASDGSLWWLALVMIAIILGMLYLIRRQF